MKFKYLLVLPLIVTCAQASVISPISDSARDGITAVVFGPGPTHFQWIFDPTLNLPPVGSVITGIGFSYHDTTPPTVVDPTISFDDWDLQLSSSPNVAKKISKTFADNVGGDAVTVYNGPLSITTSVFDGGGFYVINFTTPYVYEGGELLFDLTYGARTGNSFWVDGGMLPTKGVSTDWSPDPTSPKGDAKDLNFPITELVYTVGYATPEPGTDVLFVVGLSAMCGVICRQRMTPAKAV